MCFSCINMDNCSVIYLKTHWQTFAVNLNGLQGTESISCEAKLMNFIYFVDLQKYENEKKKRGVSTVILVGLFFWQKVCFSSIFPLWQKKLVRCVNIVVISVL